MIVNTLDSILGRLTGIERKLANLDGLPYFLSQLTMRVTFCENKMSKLEPRMNNIEDEMMKLKLIF